MTYDNAAFSVKRLSSGLIHGSFWEYWVSVINVMSLSNLDAMD